MTAASLDGHRVVQVIARDGTLDRKLRLGSGYLIGAGLVLTAAHVVNRAEEVTVRRVLGRAWQAQTGAQIEWIEADPLVDLAVLRLVDDARAAEAFPTDLAGVEFGRIEGQVRCETVGFPLFMLRRNPPSLMAGERLVYRDTHHAVGTATSLSGQYSGTLELTVDPPRENPDPQRSPWQGMSGAAVFAGGALVAVVCQHHREEGANRITARRVESWYDLEPAAFGRLRDLLSLPGRDCLSVVSDPQSAGADVCGSGLPRDSSVFTGRERELAELESSLESRGGVLAIHAVDGLAGVGKTAFAVHAAHRIAHRFPDGQVFLRLHAHTPGVAPVDPANALADLLLGDGLAPSKLPDGLQGRSRLWRERTARRQMLLILDDAAESAQVIPLLPAAPGTLVMITSRQRLDGLEDVVPFSLGALSRGEAAALIVRTARYPGLDATDPDVMRLAELCGFLPLALSITAARLAAHPGWSAAGLATQLTQGEDRLEVLAGRERSVAAALELSYRDLNEAQSRLLRLLGVHPGTSYEPEATAALLDVNAGAARSLLDELEGHRLLDGTAPGRYRMHDLVRTYAADASRRDHPEDSDLALARLLKHYARSQRTDSGGSPAPETTRAWLRAEQENLLACIDHAHCTGRHADALRLSDTIAPLLIKEAPLDVAVDILTRARNLAHQIGDRGEEANALASLGQVLWMRGRLAAGQAALTEAENLYRQIGEPSQNHSTGLIQLGHLNDDHVAAQRTYAEARDLAEQSGDLRGQADALTSLGLRWLETDRYAEAKDAYTKALELYQQIGDRKRQTRTLLNIGQAQTGLRQHTEAEAIYTKALESARQFGDWQDEVFALNQIGELRRLAGDYAAAELFSREERQVREQAWRSSRIDPLE